jgi:Asp-tRNA(Asn)/Glu-tRNA(Gln) amidotransferase C subunit
MITPIELENIWREDIILQELNVDKIVENAPDKSGHLFRVPPVI